MLNFSPLCCWLGIRKGVWHVKMCSRNYQRFYHGDLGSRGFDIMCSDHEKVSSKQEQKVVVVQY